MDDVKSGAPMVLKIILIFILSCNLQVVASAKKDYLKANKLIKRGNVNKGINLLKKVLNDPKSNQALKALSYYSLGNAYQKKRNWNRAISNFRNYLELVKDPIIEVDSSPRSARRVFNKMAKPSKINKEVYFKLGKVYKKKYQQRKFKKHYKLALLYLSASKKFGYGVSESDRLIADLKSLGLKPRKKKRPYRSGTVSSYSKKKKRKSKLKVRNNFNIYAAFLSWQEDRVGQDQSGTEYFLLSNAKANCLGISYRGDLFGYWMYNSDVCMFKGEANIASSESGLTFSSNDNDMSGYQASLSLQYAFYKEYLVFGIGTQIFSRKASWNGTGGATSTTSTEPGITIDADNLTVLGFFIDVEAVGKIWSHNLGFFSRLGQGSAFSSAYWQIGVKYYLF
jgi:tetratricopeptide (TPR) repeat protein